MCLLVLAWKSHPRYRLVLAGNRDEFHDRAAAPLNWWQDDARILAGRDLKAGGTWLGERIRTALGDGARWNLSIRYTEEGPEPLETGGGIFNALPLLGADPFIVVNGDVWTDFPFSSLALSNGMTAHLILAPNPAHHSRGDFSLENGRVKHAHGRTCTFTGIAMYRPEFFTGCTAGKFPLLPLLRRAIDAGTLSGELYKGVWSDLGTPERLAELQSGKLA